jgi:hypothetical protein
VLQQSHSKLYPYEMIVSISSGLMSAAERELVQGWKISKYPPVLICSPVDWSRRPPVERSYEFHIQCWDMLNVILSAHSYSGDPRFISPAIEIAFDWCARHSLEKLVISMSSFAWYDMAVGMRAYRLAYLYEAADAEDLLNEEKRQQLWCSLEQHATYLADDANIAFHNNHGYYQVAGQLAMGRRFAARSPLMAKAVQQGRERLVRMLTQQFSPDGAHREHSPDYHRMVYDTLKALIDSGLVEDAETISFAQRIEEALSWFVLPNQHIVNFGDSDDRSLVRKPKEAESKWNTPEMRYWVSGGKVGQPHTGVVRAFPDGGYWVARKAAEYSQKISDYSYLALNAAFHSRTHKHADDLTLLWSDRGANILVDAGRYGYIGKAEQGSQLWLDGHWYSDPRRVYCESTRAHNTLEFDGVNFPRKGVKPYGSALKRHGSHESGVLYCEAECKQFKSIRYARTLFFMPGQWLIVFDWFHDNADAPHTVRQWFHIAHELQVLLNSGQYLVPVPGSAQMLRVCSLLPEPLGSRLHIGEEEPVMQGWWSAKERDIVPNYAFCYELNGVSSGVYATLFSFSDQLQPDMAWSKVNASGRKGQLRWTDEKGRHELRFERPAEGDLSVGYIVS